MIRLAWKRMKHRKLSTLIMFMALISIFTIIPIGLEQSQISTATINESIEQHGRGSYDLLVRPDDSRSSIEQTKGVVEENYIADSGGGISLEEWREIKEDPEIEIAAPVASLGYFKGRQFSIELPVFENPTQYTYQFYTSDGKTTYPLATENSIMYFGKLNSRELQYIKESANNESSAVSDTMTIMMPEYYNHLVAIDPESENRLTGIEFSQLDKEPKPDHFLRRILRNRPGTPIMQILQKGDQNIPLSLQIKKEQYDDVNISDYTKLLGLQENDWLMSTDKDPSVVFERLSQEKSEKTDKFKIDLSSYLSPFDGTALRLNKEFEPMHTDSYFTGLDTSTFYTASTVTYENSEDTLSVPIENAGEPPSYKNTEQKGVSMSADNELPFVIDQVGTFSTPEKQSKLTASPLGIYGEMKAHLKDRTVLTPTTIPGSFIPSPASGITSIENAEIVKGENPIDAIRVKVADITNYNDAARSKIEKISTELLEKGYDVDVVAGSSFQDVTLDVEGIGKVYESWTTLGVAQTLTDRWNVMNLITTLLLSVFGLVWLFLRLTFERHIFEPEDRTLFIIGWNKTRILWRNCMEQYLLLTISFIVSLVLLNIFNVGMIMFWIVTGLWGISLILTTLLFNQKGQKNYRTKSYKRFASLFYYKRLIIPMMLVLCLSILLLSTQLAALGDSFFKSSETTLGQFVNEQAFWFQMTVTFIIVCLSTVAFSEGLGTLFMERKREFKMYHYIGWTKRRILAYIFKESSVWFFLSSITGIFLSSLILSALGISGLWILIGVVLSLAIMIILLSTLLITRQYS